MQYVLVSLLDFREASESDDGRKLKKDKEKKRKRSRSPSAPRKRQKETKKDKDKDQALASSSTALVPMVKTSKCGICKTTPAAR